MDYRLKTFEVEARHSFALLTDRGYVVSVHEVEDARRRPVSAVVRFAGQGTAVETRLAMSHAGEDSVATRLETEAGRFDFGPAVAHTGHQMRKALRAQAAEVATALGL